jgi:hypothetical protein
MRALLLWWCDLDVASKVPILLHTATTESFATRGTTQIVRTSPKMPPNLARKFGSLSFQATLFRRFPISPPRPTPAHKHKSQAHANSRVLSSIPSQCRACDGRAERE